ncbi:MAG: STAS domain-containing protein [bacterium]|nr:STAS domain-containing protein [bacterium]
MAIETKKIDNITIIYLSGRLDLHSSPEIERNINEILRQESESDILLNFNDVHYMSSTGLRMLVSMMKKLKKSRKQMKLCEMNDITKEILQVTDLVGLFELFESEEKALQSFSG